MRLRVRLSGSGRRAIRFRHRSAPGSGRQSCGGVCYSGGCDDSGCRRTNCGYGPVAGYVPPRQTLRRDSLPPRTSAAQRQLRDTYNLAARAVRSIRMAAILHWRVLRSLMLSRCLIARTPVQPLTTSIEIAAN